MFRFRALTLALGLLLAAAGTPGAKAATVEWIGLPYFNDLTIYFGGGFTANELTSIAGPGTYEGSNKGSTTFDLYIKLNGDWTLLKEWSAASNARPVALSTLVTSPLAFALGTVTGIKLTSNPDGGLLDPNYQTFFRLLAGTIETFTFGTSHESGPSPAPTPLPGALTLFAGGLVLVGLMSRRRKPSAR